MVWYVVTLIFLTILDISLLAVSPFQKKTWNSLSFVNNYQFCIEKSNTHRIFHPETVLRWHRELVRRVWIFSQNNTVGRSSINKELENPHELSPN